MKDIIIGDIVKFTGKDDYEWRTDYRKCSGKVLDLCGDKYIVKVSGDEYLINDKGYIFYRTWIKK